MKWLQGLLAEAEKVTDFKDSDEEAESGAQVLGELPDHLKKLFTYNMALYERLKDLRKEIEETDSKKAAGELRQSVKRLEKRFEIASSIMWEEIKFEFREQTIPGKAFRVRKGWRVCMLAPEMDFPSFLNLLGEIS